LVALLFIDIDHFKQLNDTFGQADAAAFVAKRSGRNQIHMAPPVPA